MKVKLQDFLPSGSILATSSLTLYIDFDVGADNETEGGSEKKPYQSLPCAYIQAEIDKASCLTRQSVTSVVSVDGDPCERLVWKEPA